MSHHQQDWKHILREAGHRVTPQRGVVLDAVCAGHGHTSLSEIHGRVRAIDPSINQSTVYRALRTFQTAGIVVVADTGGPEPYFEIAKPKPHHHLHCRVCGREQEIGADDLESVVDHLASRYGFQVSTDHIVFFGRCETCALASPASPGT